MKEDEYIVERAGKPLVAIIPIEEYQRMKKEKNEFFQMFEDVQKGVRPAGEKTIDLEIEAAIKSSRKGKAGR